MFSDQDRSFMEMALDEAQLSFNDNEVPVGAIIVKDNEVIGTGHNQVIHTNNVTSHAEINAIIDASKNTNNYRLQVTLNPCRKQWVPLNWKDKLPTSLETGGRNRFFCPISMMRSKCRCALRNCAKHVIFSVLLSNLQLGCYQMFCKCAYH